MLALFAKNVQIDQPENAKPLNYEGVRNFFSMIFKAYRDFHVTVRKAIVDGQTAVSVKEVSGTWMGPFVDPRPGKARLETDVASTILALWCSPTTARTRSSTFRFTRIS